MSGIKLVKSFCILDSRGNPTLTTFVQTENASGSASVPSGASTGKFEAYELRDKTKAFHGRGVSKAVNNVNNIISKKLKGMNVFNQEKIDYVMKELDGTPNKSKLGANAILSVSLAVARCAANEKKVELFDYLGGFKGFPTPLLNVINGGKHAGNKMNIQECMIIPDTKSFNEDMRIASETYQELKSVIEKKYGRTAVNVGDEGGFAPPVNNVEDAFKLVIKALDNLGYSKKVGLGIDAASSEFYNKGRYELDDKKISKTQLLDYYKSLSKKYPLWSIEDPFEENDFETTALLNKELRGRVQIVGDDLLVTNTERVLESVKHNSCTALLLKVNQAGTLTEANKACRTAQKNNMKVVVSHRSGETCDNFISDLCLGWGCSQIKAGAPCRSERTSKYNRLMILEQLMKD
ncbi:MAG: phosphopyruvate hydratase [Nanoarchaeota archaeon]|nr:phosphopyruvate hydratase [Nanoarchaeota archaeon]